MKLQKMPIIKMHKPKTNSSLLRSCASVSLVKGVFSVGYHNYLKTLNNTELRSEFNRLKGL